MKIQCDKCGENISPDIDVKFDKLQVGYVVCPKCHKENKRYISETDLLLYLGLSELFYLILSIITTIVIDKVSTIYISIGIVVVMFAIAWIVQKQIDRFVYEKAYFKEELKYTNMKEDEKTIGRSLVWQSMLFLALVITFVTTTEAKWFFLTVSILAIVLTFVKFYLSLRNEKNSNKK